jgi:23S rRNA maturation mini-RNase III
MQISYRQSLDDQKKTIECIQSLRESIAQKDQQITHLEKLLYALDDERKSIEKRLIE